MSALREAIGSLSVVIPAYNAEAAVGATVAAVHDYLADADLEHEIIIVDDGSRDNTAAAAGRCAGPVTVIRCLENRGKGAAVRRGMLASRLDWALFIDVDHSTRIENVDQIARVAAGADVVVASRRASGAKIVTTQPIARRMLGNLFPFFTRVAALPGVSDTQCGFKAFRKPLIRPVFEGLRVERFAFDVEALLRARRLGARLVEIPVDWDNPTGSTVRWSRDGPQMLADLVKTTWRHRPTGAEARRLAAFIRDEAPGQITELKPLIGERINRPLR